MTLNDLLKAKHIDPKQVVVMRHRPREAALNKVLPWLAAEQPDVFNAYQQTQREKAERVLQNVKYVASFIRWKPGQALFIGLYAVNGWTQMATSDCVRIPAIAKLNEIGMTGLTNKDAPA